MRKPELLAPAGDMECLKTAFRFGADAAYLGGPFMQLRSKVTGFDLENIRAAAEVAHGLKKKIYVYVVSLDWKKDIYFQCLMLLYQWQ